MPFNRAIAVKTSCFAAFALAGSFASAASPIELGFSAGQVKDLRNLLNAPVVSPGIALGSPVGFGASWRELAIGVGGSTLRKGASASSDDYDGALSVLFGLGDAQESVALETLVNINSLQESFGNSGSVGFKLHTNLPNRTAVAFGVESVARFGDAKRTESSVYIVGTKFVDVFSLPLALNLGLGNNRFNDGPDDSTANVFGGAALYVHPQVSVIADWTGNALDAGISIVPLKKVPVTVTLGASNATSREVNRNSTNAEFIAGIGLYLTF